MATQEASMLSDSRSPGSVQGAKRGCVMLGCRDIACCFCGSAVPRNLGTLPSDLDIFIDVGCMVIWPIVYWNASPATLSFSKST